MKRDPILYRPETPADRLAALATNNVRIEFDSGPFEKYIITRVKQGWKVAYYPRWDEPMWIIESTLDDAIDAVLTEAELMTEDEHEAEERELMEQERK